MKSKDMYMFVAGSIPEIRENAEAALILQCDPDGILEEEARRSGNITSLADKCGPGLWRALGIERENFPSHDGTVSEDLDRELLPGSQGPVSPGVDLKNGLMKMKELKELKELTRSCPAFKWHLQSHRSKA